MESMASRTSLFLQILATYLLAIGTINPFKQPKHALEFKLSNFENLVNCKHFICLPDHNNCPTA